MTKRCLFTSSLTSFLTTLFQLQSASNEIIGDLSEEKIFPHAYPIMQHAIANASSSVFLGEKLAKDESLVDAFKNITLECAAEIPQDNWVYDRFTMLNTWRQRWIGKFSKRLQKRKSQLYNALKSEVEERLTGLETPGWERPVSQMDLCLFAWMV